MISLSSKHPLAMHGMQNGPALNARCSVVLAENAVVKLVLQIVQEMLEVVLCRMHARLQNMPNLFFVFSTSAGGPALPVLAVSVPFFSDATFIGSDPVAAARMAAIPI